MKKTGRKKMKKSGTRGVVHRQQSFLLMNMPERQGNFTPFFPIQENFKI
jgi:hypothetical protein